MIPTKLKQLASKYRYVQLNYSGCFENKFYKYFVELPSKYIVQNRIDIFIRAIEILQHKCELKNIEFDVNNIEYSGSNEQMGT